MEVMTGEWWKMGVYGGRAVYTRRIPAEFKIALWFDIQDQLWKVSSSKLITFASGWTCQDVATMAPQKTTYNFTAGKWTVLWEDSLVQVRVVPASVMKQTIAEHSREAWF